MGSEQSKLGEFKGKFRRSVKDPRRTRGSSEYTPPLLQPRADSGAEQGAINLDTDALVALTLGPISGVDPTTVSLPADGLAAKQPSTVDVTDPINKLAPPSTASGLWAEAMGGLTDEDRQEITSGEGYGINLVDGLISEVEERKKECDGKRLFYTNKQGEKIFYVRNLLEQLNKYAMIGDIALQHHPDIVALAWSGFRLLLQVGTAYTGSMQAVSESLGYFMRILYCCDIYEKLYCKGTLEMTGLLKGSLVGLYTSILEYLCYAKRYLEKGTSARVLESFRSGLQELLEKIRDLEKDVEDNAGMAEKEAAAKRGLDEREMANVLNEELRVVQGSVQRIEHVVSDIFTSLQKEKRTEILAWLSDVQFTDHHSYSSDRRQENTGHWLIENDKYLEWKHSESSSILWLRGNAGAGKTMLASSVIDLFQGKVKGRQHMLAYFYCHYATEGRSDPESVLRALVKQLCLANMGPFFPEPVLSIYNLREEQGHSSGPLKLNESKDLIISLSKGFANTTIVIDGLDECNKDKRRGLFRALNDIVSSTERVKIFVTGRNDTDIQQMLADSPSYYINATDNREDINIYIRSEIDRRCNPKFEDGKPLLGGFVSAEMKEKIISALQKKANGMFIWAHFQILAICEENTPGGVEKALDKLPKDLRATYSQIIQRVDSQAETARNTAAKVLTWIFCAQGSCSPSVVIQSLTVSPGEANLDTDAIQWTISSILGVCQNLIVHNKPLNKLQFAHLSVKEFLQDQPEFSLPKAQTSVAEICLTALTYYSPSQAVLIPDLLGYSVLNWAAHVRLSNTGSIQLEALWRGFLSSSQEYKQWALKISKQKSDLYGGEGYEVISPFWVSCYYQLYDISRFLSNSGADPNSYNRDGKTPLAWAASSGSKGVVQMLLGMEGADVNRADKNRQTPLSLAVFHGHEEIVQMLLGVDGVDVSWTDKYSRTLLSLAVFRGHGRIVQMLLGIDGVDVTVNRADNDRRTPLSLAVFHGHEEIVQMLLGINGVDVNRVDKDRQTPLSLAVIRGHGRIVQMLLRVDGVDISWTDKYSRTLLSLAVCGGHGRIVQMLLGIDGVDVNRTDKDSRTPLSLAAFRGYGRIVQMLLGVDGVDVNRADKDSQTPLSLAAFRGHGRIVQMLLGVDGVDVNRVDNNARTPLLLAVIEGHKKIVQMLLEVGMADVNCKDGYGMVPLSHAADNGNQEIIQMLLQCEGVDLDHKDVAGRTPLVQAVINRHKTVVQMLLDTGGVDVNCRYYSGKTPLSIAIGDPGIVESLLDTGKVKVDINSQNSLSWAVFNGHQRIVQLLLGTDGLDVNHIDEGGQTALFWAVYYQHWEILQMLLRVSELDVDIMGDDGETLLSTVTYGKDLWRLLRVEGVDVNHVDKNGQTALLRAVIQGDQETIQILLETDKVDVNIHGAGSETPLSYAAYQGHRNIVQMLLDVNGVDVNCVCESGQTPLLQAVTQDHQAIVKILLRTGKVDVNIMSNNGHTPLSRAVHQGHHEILQMLLEVEGVDVNCVGENGQTPLLRAVTQGHVDIVRMLLETDSVGTNQKDSHGRTPLSRAIEHGNKQVLYLLLKKDGVDINCRDENGQTPLLHALRYSRAKVIPALLKNGADVNCTDDRGRTPLSMAVRGNYRQVAKLLLRKDGLFMNPKELTGQTPLAIAAELGHEDLIRMLLAKDGVNVNVRDNNGRTPLFWAVTCRREKIVQLLLDKEGVDVNCRDSHGRTPLLWAVSYGSHKLVELFLAKTTVDVNARDSLGRTPLSRAVENDRARVVQLLLKRDGVKIRCRDNNGQTPLSWARANGNVGMLRILKGAIRARPKKGSSSSEFH